MAWLLTRQAGAWTPDEFIAAVQLVISDIEPGPLPERRDPSIQTTLHDRIGLIPSLLGYEPAEVFARLHNGAYVLECLPAALYCFLRGPDNVEEMLLCAPACSSSNAVGGTTAMTPTRRIQRQPHIFARLLNTSETPCMGNTSVDTSYGRSPS